MDDRQFQKRERGGTIFPHIGIRLCLFAQVFKGSWSTCLKEGTYKSIIAVAAGMMDNFLARFGHWALKKTDHQRDKGRQDIGWTFQKSQGRVDVAKMLSVCREANAAFTPDFLSEIICTAQLHFTQEAFLVWMNIHPPLQSEVKVRLNMK